MPTGEIQVPLVRRAVAREAVYAPQADQTLRPQRTGDLVVHCGKLLHAGAPITHGERHIVVGFVKVSERAVRVETWRGRVSQAPAIETKRMYRE